MCVDDLRGIPAEEERDKDARAEELFRELKIATPEEREEFTKFRKVNNNEQAFKLVVSTEQPS